MISQEYVWSAFWPYMPLALLPTFEKMFFLLILCSVVNMKSFASFKRNLAAIFAFFGLLYKENPIYP